MGTWMERLSRLAASALMLTALVTGMAHSQQFDRRDVTIPSQGLKLAAWYYTPTGVQPGQKVPAIVMAHGFSGVKEMYLDNFARKFAEAGFAVVVFDYRFFGGSEGEPRGQLLWPEQIQDYRNAITWAGLQNEVDPQRIGVWGTSYSGGHVLYLGAYDRRIKAIVAQVPVADVWDTYFSGMPEDQQRAFWPGWPRIGQSGCSRARSIRSLSPRLPINLRSGLYRSGTTHSWISANPLRSGPMRSPSTRWILMSPTPQPPRSTAFLRRHCS